jgi:hypothetical protein
MAVLSNATLLNRLAACSEKSKFLVLQENIHCRSKRLFRSFLHQSSQNPSVRTFLILLQSDQSDFTDLTNTTIDPLFNNYCRNEKVTSLKQQLAKFTESCDSSKANRVFIDSLNILFLHYDLSEVNIILNSLTEKCDTIVTTVCDSVLDSRQRALIQRVATTCVKLSSAEIADHMTVNISHKRKHRTMGLKEELKQETIRLFDGKFEVIKNLQTKSTPVTASPGDEDLSKLTFNLNLSEEQKLAKDKVQLPYIR